MHSNRWRVLGTVLFASACARLLGIPDDTLAPVEAASDGGFDGAITTEPEPTDVIYVAADGSDSNSGLEKAAPKRTLAAAIGANLEFPEIHVCGTAIEAPTPLVIERPVVLVGGWDCFTWERKKELRPAVTISDAIEDNVQKLETILVTGQGADDRVKIENFTIKGPKRNGFTAAVRITEGAAPQIVNSTLVAGVGSATSQITVGPVGLIVERRARPLIAHNHISGGNVGLETPGSTADYHRRGAIGVYDATPTIQDNIIDSGPLPAVGLFVTRGALDEEIVIERNEIHLGKTDYAWTGAPVGAIGIGAYLFGKGISVFRDNVVTGFRDEREQDADVKNTGPRPVTIHGIYAASRSHIAMNRVAFGPTVGPVAFSGIIVAHYDANVSYVESNGVLTPTGVQGAPINTFGIHVAGGNAMLRFNTIYVSARWGRAVELSTFSVDNGADPPGDTAVESNLFVANYVTQPLQAVPEALFAYCNENATGNVLPHVANNAAAGLAVASRDAYYGQPIPDPPEPESDQCQGQSLQRFATWAEVPAPIGPGNVQMLCDAGSACPPRLLDGWSGAGLKEILLRTKFKLRDGVSCAIAQGGKRDSGPGVLTDIAGNPRNVIPTIGAWQSDAACSDGGL